MIKLFIKVTPNSKKIGFNGVIEVEGKSYLKLGIKSPPIDGKANEAVIKFISEYFNISKGLITITSGLTSKYKAVTIAQENQEITTKIKTLLNQ